MKKLVVIGASLAALAIAVWLVRSQPVGDASPAESSQPASPSPPAKPPEPVVLAPAVESARTIGTQPAPIDEQRAQPTAAARTDEARQVAECRARWKRENTAEQVARASETKDAGWAYPTEQGLREYFSRRFKTIPIEVMVIDCRTTFCEIKARGFVPEGAHEFQTALAEVGKESWNDFTGSSFSQTEEANPVYTGEVSRRRSYATAYRRHDDPEQVACANLLGRQNQQRQAARDAEPRDTGWADPMEQLLRMHFATQLTKHPLEQLEIICRTSFCQIKAKGKSDDALIALQKATAALESEPWANLGSGAGGSSGYGDSWAADFTLIRR